MKNETVRKKENDVNDKFYIAVDDITLFRGKKDNYKRYYADFKNQIPISQLTEEEKKTKKIPDFDTRIIGNRFVNNPVTAVLNVVYSNPKHSNNKEVQKELFKRLQYDPKNQIYSFEEYFTIGTMLPPKESHLEKFKKGEYELYIVRHEIQVLSTNVESFNLAEVKKNLLSTKS